MTESTGAAAADKPKRVRTGCLTCRERHLKCDEGVPDCVNCKKSNRKCKRGVRLNFIDITVKQPPHIPVVPGFKISFQDESKDIASEYQGGLAKYAHCDKTILPPAPQLPLEFLVRPQNIDHSNALPPMQSTGQYGDDGLMKQDYTHSRENSRHHSIAGSDQTMVSYLTAPTTNSEPRTPSDPIRTVVDNPEQMLFFQVFVEEVGIWMDSMDPHKHFSRLIPFHAMRENMLYHAILACGARHLTLVNPDYHEDRALFYYDTATTQLLRSLQNPERDTVICATTAVILNVYEIMSERAMQRMNHIAGARALIKECGWNARSTGIGAACFWLNVGMELLSCLHFNWQVAWEPELWGLDMNMDIERESGREELWVHRMLFIVGKVSNFRASIPRFQEKTQHDEERRLKDRFAQWTKLRDMCDTWNKSVPISMHPIGYLAASQTSSKSAFPEVWLIKRATIVGRLFYHTAMCLLHQINPYLAGDHPEMQPIQLAHAHQICGITAHVKDRGVASVALRSLAIAAECLSARVEQEEVLKIFDKIKHETGWKVDFLHNELKTKWGWNEEIVQPTGLSSFFQQSQPPVMPPTVPKPRAPSGIVNPMYKDSDFSGLKHPYMGHYQPPSTQAMPGNSMGWSGPLPHFNAPTWNGYQQ